jgi:DNA-binding response OmpR family regulator
MTILYIDDDLEDHEILSDVLKAIHPEINLLHARSGGKAIQMLDEMVLLPEIIMTDLNIMGELNGKDVISILRKDKRFNDIPLLMYSTSSAIKDHHEAIQCGATEFIVKPTSYSELRKVLEEVISRHGKHNYKE